MKNEYYYTVIILSLSLGGIGDLGVKAFKNNIV